MRPPGSRSGWERDNSLNYLLVDTLSWNDGLKRKIATADKCYCRFPCFCDAFSRSWNMLARVFQGAAASHSPSVRRHHTPVVQAEARPMAGADAVRTWAFLPPTTGVSSLLKVSLPCAFRMMVPHGIPSPCAMNSALSRISNTAPLCGWFQPDRSPPSAWTKPREIDNPSPVPPAGTPFAR